MAVANVHGPAAGLSAIESIGARDLLNTYYLFHAVLGQFHFELKNFAEARRRFHRASELTGAKSEQTFLQNRLKECDAKMVQTTWVQITLGNAS